MTRTVTGLLAAAMVAVLATGCGVPTERAPRAIGTPLPFPSDTASAAPDTSAGTLREKLYLVKGDMLVAVERRSATAPTVDTVMRDLMAGPTQTEQNAGLSSALPGTDVTSTVTLTGNQVVVKLASGTDQTGRNNEVLAIAEVVCSLAVLPGVDGVSFTRDGQPVSVPRADGTLSPGPLTLADYAALITR